MLTDQIANMKTKTAIVLEPLGRRGSPPTESHIEPHKQEADERTSDGDEESFGSWRYLRTTTIAQVAAITAKLRNSARSSPSSHALDRVRSRLAAAPERPDDLGER